MKHSVEFDDILNECLERILQGETIDTCLARHPQYAEKLKPLLETGLQVRKATSVLPRPEFRTNARLQFQSALNASERKTNASFFEWLKRPQWAAVTAFALLVVLGTTTAALSSGAMPDQPLYPVKLTVEKIQIALTPSPESRGELYARFLERRLNEVQKMAAENKTDKIQRVTDRLDSMVSAIASLTTNFDDASKNAVTSPAAPEATAPAPGQTNPFEPAPPSVQPMAPQMTANQAAITAASPAVNTTAAETDVSGNGIQPAAEAANVTAVPSASDRSSLATVDILNDAAANLARLRDLLASAPEAQRPALRNAITAAENVYEAIVKYLANE